MWVHARAMCLSYILFGNTPNILCVKGQRVSGTVKQLCLLCSVDVHNCFKPLNIFQRARSFTGLYIFCIVSLFMRNLNSVIALNHPPSHVECEIQSSTLFGTQFVTPTHGRRRRGIWGNFWNERYLKPPNFQKCVPQTPIQNLLMVSPRSVSLLNWYNIIILGLPRFIMTRYTRRQWRWLANCFEVDYLIERTNVYRWKQLEHWVNKLYSCDVRPINHFILHRPKPSTCLLVFQPLPKIVIVCPPPILRFAAPSTRMQRDTYWCSQVHFWI